MTHSTCFECREFKCQRTHRKRVHPWNNLTVGLWLSLSWEIFFLVFIITNPLTNIIVNQRYTRDRFEQTCVHRRAIKNVNWPRLTYQWSSYQRRFLFLVHIVIARNSSMRKDYRETFLFSFVFKFFISNTKCLFRLASCSNRGIISGCRFSFDYSCFSWSLQS